MTTTTKNAIIDRIGESTGVKRSIVRQVIHCFFDTVIADLKAGKRLEFRDFGVFETRKRAARTAQNPKTLQQIPIPARRAVRFKGGRLMREALEGNSQAKRRQPVSTSDD